MAEREPLTRVEASPIYRRLWHYLAPQSLWLLLSIAGFALYSLGTVLLADVLQFLLDALSGVQGLPDGSQEAARGLPTVAGAPQQAGGILSGLSQRFFVGSQHSMLDVARVVIPLAVIVITAVRGIGYLAGNYSIAVVSRSLVHRLRCDLFGSLLRQPAVQLDAQSQGGLVSKVTYNVELLADATTNALKTVLRESLILAALLAYMAYIDWRLCLVFVAVTPLLAAVVQWVSQRFRRYGQNIQHSMGDVTQVANESLGAFHEVRMAGAQQRQSLLFANASEASRAQSVKMALVESLSTPFLQFLVAIAFAVLVWLAMSPERLLSLSAGQLVAFLTAASQLGKPVRQLSAVQGVVQRGRVAAQDVFFNLDQPAEPNDGTVPAEGIHGRIAFEQVAFTYPGAMAPALRGVSFAIEPGETLAIVGRSGSGKSTLLQLLSRFYAPGAGKVLVDGLPIANYELSSLRRNIALVSQQAPLFRDSVYNNICFGLGREVPPARVREALTLAHASEFIEALPQGVDTLLGDDGAGLSGGQRQRIALARAILKDARILLLDEATSALDAQSEQSVQAALQTVSQGRTTVVVAHRIATVERAAKIVVLDDGTVEAIGTHTQLLATSALYRRLHQQDFVE